MVGLGMNERQQVRIKDNFSRAAKHYTELTGFHQHLAEELVNRLDGRLSDELILLDLGTGTGRLAEILKRKIPSSRVMGVDLSFEMMSHFSSGENVGLIQADAGRLPFRDGQFDMIVSNASLQWAEDLKNVFWEAKRTLRQDGALCLNLFGQKTLMEFFDAIQSVGRVSPELIGRLPSEVEVKEALLVTGWGEAKVDVEERLIGFESFQDMLGWVKKIGGNGLRHDFYFGKKLYRQLEAFFENELQEEGQIRATIEVIWVYEG